MTDYFIDDGGDNSDGLSWAKAWNSIGDMLAEPKGTSGAPLAATDRLIFGADSVDAFDYSAGVTTVYGPSSGAPCVALSSTVGSGTTVSYAAGTARHINTSETSTGYQGLAWDGSWALHGLYQQVMAIDVTADANETFYMDGGTVLCMTNQVSFTFSDYAYSKAVLRGVTIDCTADGTTDRSSSVIQCGYFGDCQLHGLIFANVSKRTGAVISCRGTVTASGCDFSGFTNATTCELLSLGENTGTVIVSNSKTAATWAPFTGTPPMGYAMMTNVGPSNAPTYLALRTYLGDVVSSASIYRTGGAEVEGTETSWLITTTANCGEGAPFYTPWLYGFVSSTGSKTFTLHTTNDTADLTDAEAWLEIEYLKDADEAQSFSITDQRVITTTAAAQTDDTASTWNGTGPSFTYKQSLAVTATVGEEGKFRARVAIGKASIASSSYLYIDPQVFVDGVAAGTGAYLVPGAGIVDYTCAGGSSPRIGDRTGGLR